MTLRRSVIDLVGSGCGAAPGGARPLGRFTKRVEEIETGAHRRMPGGAAHEQWALEIILWHRHAIPIRSPFDSDMIRPQLNSIEVRLTEDRP